MTLQSTELTMGNSKGMRGRLSYSGISQRPELVADQLSLSHPQSICCPKAYIPILMVVAGFVLVAALRIDPQTLTLRNLQMRGETSSHYRKSHVCCEQRVLRELIVGLHEKNTVFLTVTKKHHGK